MVSQDWVLIGKIKAAHGLRGELFVLIFGADPEELEGVAEWAWGSLPAREYPEQGVIEVVSTVEKFHPHRDGHLLKLADCEDRNRAEALRGRGLYVRRSALAESSAGEEGLDVEDLIGYELVDPDGRRLGKVIGLSTNGVQDLLVIEHPGGQAEVPLVDDFLVEIDEEVPRLVMDLPEGLFDLEGKD